jgi:uncharacterized protein
MVLRAPTEKELYNFFKGNRKGGSSAQPVATIPLTGNPRPLTSSTEHFFMAKKSIRLALLIGAGLLLALSPAPSALALKKNLLFLGGPAGGTFQLTADAIAEYPEVKTLSTMRVTTRPSAGSVANLREVHAGQADFGLVYSGHAYLGRKGLLQDDKKTYNKVLAVAALYGAPAQVVVRKGTGIRRIKDLKGKRVGVGSPGSGSFANCELFFNHLGVWDAIIPVQTGYNEVATAFAKKELDAFCLFTAFPSSAITMAAGTDTIDLLNLDAEIKASGFSRKYPYFTARTLPAGSYPEVTHKTRTFQDSTLWVAGAEVPDEVVYRLLSSIYDKKGLLYMVRQNPILKDMSLRSGARDVIIPLHPGARRFWKERGLL